MSRDFLSYWKPATAMEALENRGILEHSASHQYGRVSPGDRVWIVSVLSEGLTLLGHIQVGQVLTWEEAAKALGTQDLWEAEFHILAEPGSGEEIRKIPVNHLADRLRFVSTKGNDHLTLTDGAVNPQQLQAMRLLDPAAVPLLAREPSIRPRERQARMEQPIPPTNEQMADPTYAEGGTILVEMTRYERDPRARQACLDHYGACCQVCEVPMDRIYGRAMTGYIHIHHIRPLAKQGTHHRVDPTHDLLPVCPNCHTYLHQEDPPISIARARTQIRKQREAMGSLASTRFPPCGGDE